MPYSIPSFLNVTVLHYNVFLQRLYKSNQQLAVSRLMHNKHCSSAIFSYQELERRSAQETLIGCAKLHYKRFKGTGHLICTAPIRRKLMNNKLERMWKEAAVA
jgi:hypothetical protein